jgi:3D (Asp-Asp-Asp) domain-containing protein
MKNILSLMAVALVAVGTARASKTGQQIGQRIEAVRTTAYTYGTAENGDYPVSNALGRPLKAGSVRSAAADWSVYPVGTKFRVVESGQEYIVDDYGSAMVGSGTIDLFKPSTREMDAWGVRKVTIEILEWGSPERSLEILSDRKSMRHIREMVSRLELQKVI